MGAVVAIVAIIAVFSLSFAKMVFNYLITSEKLKQESADNQKLQQQIFDTMETQEDMQARLELLEQLLRERGEIIPDYSPEAIRLEKELTKNKNLK